MDQLFDLGKFLTASPKTNHYNHPSEVPKKHIISQRQLLMSFSGNILIQLHT